MALHVYHNDEAGWWVARSPDAARRMAFGPRGPGNDREDSEMEFTQELDEKLLLVNGKIRTYSEWAKKNGEGFLGY